MTRRSLRLRLLVVSMASIAAALVLAGFVLVALFGRHVERRVDEELSAHIRQLAGRVAFAADGTFSLTADPADPRFAEPLSGLYWQVQEDASGSRLRSRSLWDYVLALPDDDLARGIIHTHLLPGPADARLVAQERPVQYEAGGGQRVLRIAVAIDTRSLDRLRAEFAADLVLPLVALGAILAFAAWVQIWLGLRPLDAVRRGIGAVRARAQRRLAGRFPDEIMPLVSEVNELLDAQERVMEHARNRAADLAHGLKTPLTVLVGDARKLRSRGEGEIAAELETIARSMQRHVDHQLARARLAADAARSRAEADLGSIVEAVVATLRRTPQGERIAWSVAVPVGRKAPVDASDLTEVVGNLLENAAKWARRAVRVEAVEQADRVALRVLDDGPGIPDERIEVIGARGIRLDEATPGSGLGLAIVRDIAAAYGGELTLHNRPEGGLAVTAFFPRVA